MGQCSRLEGPRHEIRLGDADYPPLMGSSPGAPERLYVVGDPQALQEPFLTVVGSRKATPYGLACAEMAASVAVRMDVPLLSGAAIGCDQAAQRAALARGGRVCAVLGSGANVVYPPSSRDLLEDIVASGGAVVSIVQWDTEPLKWAFVKRDDVLAALAELVVVVEAGLPSGTFHTVEHALDLEREVFVFPGSVFAPQSRGSNYLAAEWPGVGVVWDEQCLEVACARLFGRLRFSAPAPDRRPKEKGRGPNERMVAALVASPMKPAALAQACGMALPDCMKLLGRLELEGRIVRLVDGTYGPTVDEYNDRTTRA